MSNIFTFITNNLIILTKNIKIYFVNIDLTIIFYNIIIDTYQLKLLSLKYFPRQLVIIFVYTQRR